MKKLNLLESFSLMEAEILYKKTQTKNKPRNVIPCKISCSQDVFSYTKELLDEKNCYFESSWALLLNRQNNIIAWALISKGGITGTVIDSRMVLMFALNKFATGIILVHNHPSGNLQPSDADIKITKDLKAACDIMKISLLDHVIITEDSYTSLADKGIL